MPSKVYSAAVVGVEAFEVEIEVHAGWGNSDKIAVVGLPDTAVKESKDRVTSAISNSGLRWPGGKRITINLAPADVRKEGPSFDLPIALGMLKLEESNRLPDLDAFCISGDHQIGLRRTNHHEHRARDEQRAHKPERSLEQAKDYDAQRADQQWTGTEGRHTPKRPGQVADPYRHRRHPMPKPIRRQHGRSSPSGMERRPTMPHGITQPETTGIAARFASTP